MGRMLSISLVCMRRDTILRLMNYAISTVKRRWQSEQPDNATASANYFCAVIVFGDAAGVAGSGGIGVAAAFELVVPCARVRIPGGVNETRGFGVAEEPSALAATRR